VAKEAFNTIAAAGEALEAASQPLGAQRYALNIATGSNMELKPSNATQSVAMKSTFVAALLIGGGSRGVIRGAVEVSRSRAAGVLATNLIAAGVERSEGKAAHHIVAFAAKAAEPARKALANFGININASENGAFVDRAVHAGLHTKKYFQEVNRLIGQAKTREEAVEALKYIAGRVSAGTFPR